MAGVYAVASVASLQETVQTVWELMDELRRHGLGEDELVRTKEALVNRHVFRYDDFATTVRSPMRARTVGLPEGLPEKYPSLVREVSLDSAKEIGRRYIDRSQGIAVIVGDVKTDDPRWRELFPRGDIEIRSLGTD